MARKRKPSRPGKTPKPAMPDELLEQVARRFQALSVPSRLRILNSLMNGPRSMADLATETGLEQSNLSRQVKELELAGCVARAKTGRSVQVEIADPTLQELCELVCTSLVRRLADRQRVLGKL